MNDYDVWKLICQNTLTFARPLFSYHHARKKDHQQQFQSQQLQCSEWKQTITLADFSMHVVVDDFISMKMQFSIYTSQYKSQWTQKRPSQNDKWKLHIFPVHSNAKSALLFSHTKRLSLLHGDCNFKKLQIRFSQLKIGRAWKELKIHNKWVESNQC